MSALYGLEFCCPDPLCMSLNSCFFPTMMYIIVEFKLIKAVSGPLLDVLSLDCEDYWPLSIISQHLL